MPDTPTPRLALYKSDPDGSELVNYTQDIAGNMDKLDNAAGFLASTSSTRPASPWNGQAIRESDTGRYRVWNGTAWVELVTPGAAPTFTAQVNANGGLLMQGSSGTSVMAALAASGDTSNRFSMNASGLLLWGSGAAAGDTNLYRGGANLLQTDDSLTVAGTVTTGALTVNGIPQGAGLMGKATVTSNVTFGATETTIMTVPSFTWKNGRAYRVMIYGYLNAPASGGATFQLRKGTGTGGTAWVTQLRQSTLASNPTSNVGVYLGAILLQTSGADFAAALTLTGQQSGTSQTLTWGANATSSATYLTVEDVGSASNWPGVAIS